MTDGNARRRMDTQIALSAVNNIAYLTLDGPPRNALNISFFERLSSVVTQKLSALSVDALVIEGAGRHFSSGANLPEIEALCITNRARAFGLLKSNVDTFLSLGRLPYPVIAVIRGACLGAGMELALACRYRVAEENAVFALPEVTFGMMPGCGGTIRLPKLIGERRALELILTGRTVSGEEAADIGLVDRCVARGRGMAAALDILKAHRKQAS